MIAFTMINVLNLLIDFIAKINGKENKVMDIILISIAIFIVLAWMFNLQDIPNYLRLNFNSGGFRILRIPYPPPTFIIELMFCTPLGSAFYYLINLCCNEFIYSTGKVSFGHKRYDFIKYHCLRLSII